MPPPTYIEFPPGSAAGDMLVCGWQRRPGPAGDIVVLPDGCADIVWRSDGALFVAGPDRGPMMHPQPADAGFVGVRIKPGAAATVLGVGVPDLCDRQVPLPSLWGGSAERLRERLAAADSDPVRRRMLAMAVMARVGDTPLDEQVLLTAADLRNADVPVHELCRRARLGERQLRRRFVEQVGYGPRTYRRVMRLQQVLRLSRGARPDEHPALAVLAALGGYADQSHLTRECRRLAGTTPAVLFAPTGAAPRTRSDRVRNIQDGAPPA